MLAIKSWMRSWKALEVYVVNSTVPEFTISDLNWHPFYRNAKDGCGNTMCTIVGARYDGTEDITRNIEWIECIAGAITTNEYRMRCRGLGRLTDLSDEDACTSKQIHVTFMIIDTSDRTAYCSMLKLEPHSYDITSDGTYLVGIGSITSLPMDYGLVLSMYNMRKTGGSNNAE